MIQINNVQLFIQCQDITALLSEFKTHLSMISKSNAAKLIKDLVLDSLDKTDVTIDVELKLQICQFAVQLSQEYCRHFLRQVLDIKFIELLIQALKLQEALDKISILAKELKRTESNELLAKLNLCESRIYLSKSNLQKARAALSSAKSLSNSVFTSQLLQADLDMQTGRLNALEYRDYNTAYNYLSDAFETYELLGNHERARACLKLMVTFYIMREKGGNFWKSMNEKTRLKFGDYPEIIALSEVAEAANQGSLKMFYEALQKHQKQLVEDSSINSQLAALCDEVTEKNIIKLIKPYSCVQVTHIAQKVALPLKQVEAILSTMILDRRVSGVIDQKRGVLIVEERGEANEHLEAALGVIENVSELLKSLNARISLKIK
ncbi:MAG: 26S proteasome non-ATPase regulatory subunit 11 [Marteilia pararefringens]